MLVGTKPLIKITPAYKKALGLKVAGVRFPNMENGTLFQEKDSDYRTYIKISDKGAIWVSEDGTRYDMYISGSFNDHYTVVGHSKIQVSKFK